MSIKKGNTDISKIYVGSNEVDKIYKGSTLIYEKQQPTPTGETWLINETVYGASFGPAVNINFTSNNQSFSSFYYEGLSTERSIQYNDTIVYFMGNWEDQAYRTITFETSPTGDLLTWLQQNAIKQ